MCIQKAALFMLGVYLCFTLNDAILPRETFFHKDWNSDMDNLTSLHNPDTATPDQVMRQQNNTALTKLLLNKWQQFCKAEFKLVSGSNFTGQKAVYVTCDLEEEHDWSLLDYRKWISTNEDLIYKYLPIKTGLLFAFKFQCKLRQGRVSLPWPVRAKYLWYISVDDCTVTDHLTEFHLVHNSTDYLRVIEWTNCDIETSTERLFQVMQNFGQVSRDYDCGGELTEKFVKRNMTKTFSKKKKKFTNTPLKTKSKLPGLEHMILASLQNISNTRDKDRTKALKLPNKFGLVKATRQEEQKHRPINNEHNMINQIAKVGQENQKIEHRCVYKNLKYLDQSQQRVRAKHHTHFMLERTRYPVLEYFNLSNSRIGHMSNQMLEWRRYFPNMKYMDLSHNKIKYFSTLTDNGITGDPVGILDLRHNNITTLTPDDLKTLSLHSRSVFVDIRDNPLACDCKLTHFVIELKNSSNKLFDTYTYLRNTTCASPEQHKGKIIAKLENDFCKALEVLVLVVPIITLCCCIVLLVAGFIIMVRYRKEIMILAFTRLHISLPCRQVVKNNNKEYDAFIAYSEQDGHWVFNTLLPRLEAPKGNNGPGFKLCIHHRDFPVGRCIADNILDKVQDSRHTVLILSNHFLRSQWCKYEFKTAFSQSIMEKKQHLIMVLKEELDKHLIDNDLKRCLKTFTYVKADDRLFWDKIIYALSDDNTRKLDHNLNIDNDNRLKNADHKNKTIVIKANHEDEMKIIGVDNQAFQIDKNRNVDYRVGDEGNDQLVWNVEGNNRDIVNHQGNNGHQWQHADNKGYIQNGIWDV